MHALLTRFRSVAAYGPYAQAIIELAGTHSSKDEWSVEDDRLLLAAHSWMVIAAFLL